MTITSDGEILFKTKSLAYVWTTAKYMVLVWTNAMGLFLKH